MKFSYSLEPSVAPYSLLQTPLWNWSWALRHPQEPRQPHHYFLPLVSVPMDICPVLSIEWGLLLTHGSGFPPSYLLLRQEEWFIYLSAEFWQRNLKELSNSWILTWFQKRVRSEQQPCHVVALPLWGSLQFWRKFGSGEYKTKNPCHILQTSSCP